MKKDDFISLAGKAVAAVTKKRAAILAGSFHEKEIAVMLEEAERVCKEENIRIVDTVRVPGSMEKPLAAKRLLAREDVDGLIVLGIIERGETAHGSVMAQSVLPALIQLQLDSGKPMGTGILGPEIMPQQIEPRLKPYAAAAVRALSAMLRKH